jgi:hypothetical protein
VEYPTIEHVMKITDFNKPKLAEGAIETLKWLEQGAPHKLDGLKGKFSFNMAEFIASDIEYLWDEAEQRSTSATCGTICCIAGAIHAFTKRMNGDVRHERLSTFAMNRYFKIDHHVLDYLGVNSSPLTKLFYAVLPNGEQYEFMDDITPSSAAIVLRKYLETGVVDWSHLNEA